MLPNFKFNQFPWPMALTALRLLLVPAFIYLLVIAARSNTDTLRYIALTVFAVMALTDTLDGMLARRLNQITRLGTILDPIADKLLVTGCFILLMFPRYAPAGFAIPWPVFWGVCQKDSCVLIGAMVVKKTIGKVEINANQSGKLNTVAELALIISTLLAPEWVAISPGFAAVILWSLWHLTVLATAAAAIGYSMEGSRQLRAIVSRNF